MKELTWKRTTAFLLAAIMMICTFGFGACVEAKAQTDATMGLTVPQNVQEENGFIAWDEVKGAYGYTIQASKGGNTWEYRWYENKIEWNRFIYEHCLMGDFGDYAFKVCAFDETGAATEFSSPVTVSYNATLSMPQNVEVSGANVSWDEVESAVRYNIRVYRNDESHSLLHNYYNTYNSAYINFWEENAGEYEYLVTVQAMDQDYHVSEWTKGVLVKQVVSSRLPAPQNVRFDESGKNIIWDEVEGADYYYVSIGDTSRHCEQPMLENWKRYISPWSIGYDGKQHVYVYAYNNNSASSDSSESFRFEYTPVRNEAIAVPQIKLEDDYVTWDKAEHAFRYLCRSMINGEVIDTSSYEAEYAGQFEIASYPEGDYEFELCVIDEEGNYNSKIHPLTLETVHDKSIWVPKLYHKFEALLWDYDRLRHPNTNNFWVRVRKQRDGAVVKLQREYSGYYYGLMDLEKGDYIIDACAGEYGDGYKLGPWSEPLKIEKHGDGLFDEENESTGEVAIPPEAADVPEKDRITSITINPAFNMKNKEDNNVEIDLSKIKIKASAIYDKEGLKRAETALGEVLNGNKHYNLLDLTLLYDGKDFSNGYEGLVKVIIPLPKGHKDKTFSCYRITDAGDKELIPGEQTEDSYIIYLEHFSVYALVAAEPGGEHTHNYSTDWKSDATGHWKECATCKDKTEESVHMQDAGTVTKAATKTEPGIKTYKCSICGYAIKTEEIAKLPADGKLINKKTSAATKITKKQQKKNGVILNKKVSSKISGNSLTVTWNKLKNADGYDIYAAPCDDNFKKITLSVGKNKTSAAIRKINGKKINKKKPYKVKVKAYRLLSNGKKQYLGVSATMHVIGNLNKTTTNAKDISLKKKAHVLKKGKSVQIRATIIKADKKKRLLSQGHGARLSYVSSNDAIATVTATGKIKAKKRGKCTIYVRALNGVSKKIKVTVN